MTMLVNLPLFILFYAMSPLWAKAAIYTGITKAKYLFLFRSRPAPAHHYHLGRGDMAGIRYRFTVWLDADMVKMLKH